LFKYKNTYGVDVDTAVRSIGYLLISNHYGWPIRPN